MFHLDVLFVVLSCIKVEKFVLIIEYFEVPARNRRVFCAFFVSFSISNFTSVRYTAIENFGLQFADTFRKYVTTLNQVFTFALCIVIGLSTYNHILH